MAGVLNWSRTEENWKPALVKEKKRKSSDDSERRNVRQGVRENEKRRRVEGHMKNRFTYKMNGDAHGELLDIPTVYSGAGAFLKDYIIGKQRRTRTSRFANW